MRGTTRAHDHLPAARPRDRAVELPSSAHNRTFCFRSETGTPPMEHWYLVHTKPSRERQVAVQLHQRGFVVYLPLIWVSPVNPRASRERPYFPGYLFAKLDLQSVGADVIRWSPGVKDLVEFYGEPASISDAFVAELQQCLNRVRAVGGNARDGARGTDFLLVNQGPFEG